MRIGYLMQEGVDILGPTYDGPGHHVRAVIRGLERSGHGVRVLVRVRGRIWKSDDLERFTPVFVEWDRSLRRLFERGVRRIQSELRLPYAALFESLRFAQACVQEMRDRDLLYERLSWVAYGGGLAARRLDVPLVLEDNGDPLLDLAAKGIAPEGFQLRLSTGLMHRAVHRASHVVSSGDGWRRRFITRWDYDPNRVTTIENGTDLLDVLDREQLRSFNGVEDPTEPTTFVYLGGFYPWHGVDVLLHALSSAIAKGTRARLVMIGSGDGKAKARELVDTLRLGKAVTMTDHLEPPEYASVLANAQVGVAPYCNWPEFSGLKIFDYKAAGLPTIASGRNGDPKTLKSGHTGLIVPPCDSRALSDAMVRLSMDRDMRRRMGQAARIDAEMNHGWSHTTERLAQLFDRVRTPARG